jgi:hypothetical protein
MVTLYRVRAVADFNPSDGFSVSPAEFPDCATDLQDRPKRLLNFPWGRRFPYGTGPADSRRSVASDSLLWVRDSFDVWRSSTALPLPSRQGVDCSEYNNGGDDGQGDDLFHVEVGSQPRPSKQLVAGFEIFQQRVCIWNRAAAGVAPFAGADRPARDSPRIPDSPAAFLESWRTSNERGRQLRRPYFAPGENRPTNLSRSQSSMSCRPTSCLAASMAVASSG